jgi:hypothetical protein
MFKFAQSPEPAMILRFLLAVSVAAALAACASTDAPPPISAAAPEPAPGVATRPALTGPPACTRPIAEYERVIDDDVTTGHLNQAVYNRIVNDLQGVRSSCAAGRVGPAVSDLAAVKARYGYR